MKLDEYIAPLKRWWWLLVVSAALATVSSFLVISYQPLKYISRTTLMIGRVLEDPNPDSGQFVLAQQLARTYADIAAREPLQQATMDAIGLTWLPEYHVRALPNSQLIEIQVIDTNPERAQRVASELANQLITSGPADKTGVTQKRQEFINGQLDLIQRSIEETQTEIEDLQLKISTLSSAQQIADAQNRIELLSGKLNTLQLNYATMLANSQEGAFNTLSIIEPANLPLRTFGPNRQLSVVISAVLGLVIAGSAAYIIEYFDQTLKSVEEIARFMPEARIGYISDIPKGVAGGMIVEDQPRSRIADDFRILRNNLEFLEVDTAIKTIFVASSITGEGKSTIASNLALIFSQADKKVLVIDADFRRPRAHEIFGISNRVGLSDIILNRADLLSTPLVVKRNNLRVVTTGPLPPNPTEMLRSSRMRKILEEYEKSFDIIILDGPPFITADAALLAYLSDGILWVIRPGVTRRDAIAMMREQIERSHARLLGVVVNGVSGSFSSYTDYYTRKASPRSKPSDNLNKELADTNS